MSTSHETAGPTGSKMRRIHTGRTFMRRIGTIAAALIFLFTLPAHAQFDSATVSGVVQDGTGGVLPGVDVTLTSVGTGQQRRTVTSDTGLYTFPNAPVGTYTVKATLSGFNSVT